MLLRDIKAVSLCHFLHGPAGAQYLADVSANVLKVQLLWGLANITGPARMYSSKASAASILTGTSDRLVSTSRRRKEKKWPQSQSRMQTWLWKTFGPGVFTRLGFTDKELRQLNPKLVCASASGIGSSGRMAQRPDQDLLLRAASGMISATGTPSGGNVLTGVTIVDQHGGALLAMGILGVLLRKERESKGTRSAKFIGKGSGYGSSH